MKNYKQEFKEYIKNVVTKLDNNGFNIHTNTGNLDDWEYINNIIVLDGQKYLIELDSSLIKDNYIVKFNYDSIDNQRGSVLTQYSGVMSISKFNKVLEEMFFNNEDFIKYCGINTINRLRECFIG